MSRILARSIGLLPAVVATAALLAPATAFAQPPDPPYPPGVIVGTVEADELQGTPRGDVIFALRGDDLVHSGYGSDRVFLGAGDDRARTGWGADTARGGPGEDKISTGPGNDLVLVAGDGAVDKVWCGPGRGDLAIADPDDVVADDCEFVWTRDPEA